MAAAIVIAAFLVALVVTYAAVSRRLGPDPDLDKPWFPDGHWRGQR